MEADKAGGERGGVRPHVDDEAAVAVERNRALEPAVAAARNPWRGVTEARVTYALKLVLLIAVALYLGGMVVSFLVRIASVVYIVVGAIFFAYLIYPAVDRLRRRMPLIAAVLVVYLSIVILVAIAGWLIVPGVTNDVTALAHNYPQIAADISGYVNDPKNPLLSHLPPAAREELVKIPDEVVGWLQLHGAEAAGHALTIIIGTAAAIATFIIIPLLAAYILLDLDRMRTMMLRVVPASRWATALSFVQEVDHVIGGFIRGQLIVAACVGILLTIGLLILHVPYAFLLGLIAALGDLVPYVGAVLTFIPAVLIALINNGMVNALIVAAVFVGIYELEGHFIAPAIVSRQVKLTPLSVLLAVLIGAELGGILGMLVAVPIAGVLRVIVMRLIARPSQAPVPLGANEKAP